MNTRSFAALAAALALLGWSVHAAAPEVQAAGVLLWSGLAGWAGFALFRRSLLAPRILAKAEAAWAQEASPSQILAQTEPVRTCGGEVGHRIHLLRGRAALAHGFRNAAWAEFLEADLARIPLPVRPLVRRLLRHIPDSPTPRQVQRVALAARCFPWSPSLRHVKGILQLRRPEQDSHRDAWETFKSALPLAHEDPLVLEDILSAAAGRGLEELADRAFRMLQSRHSDPRLAWDRGAAARYLLQRGRFQEALALATQVPPAFRRDEWLWVAEAAGLRLGGDLDASLGACEAGLALHPGAYRLWMEKLQTCLELRRMDEASRCLEEARRTLPQDIPELRWEWLRREAEFAFWVDEDPERALRALAHVPPEHQGGQRPPLRLQLLAATGQHEQALAALRPLIDEAPQDTSLRLLEAECLAGLEAWEALKTHLDALASAQAHPEFWHLRGLAHAHLGDPLAARMDLERAARMAPDRLRLVLDAGHACAELGEWERAEEHWRQALRLDEGCEEALVQLSDSRLALHDAEGARRMLRECLLRHPDSLDAQERLADLEAH
jgi:tetratricopeptide (TPR) repeat protein